jgi:hypothetical protein
MAQVVAGVRRKALLVAAAVASYTSDDASHVLWPGFMRTGASGKPS